MLQVDAAGMPFAAMRRLVADRPLRGAALLGLMLAICDLAVSGITLAIVSLLLPRSEWGPSAGAQIGGLSEWHIFFYAVLYAPLLETFLVQVLPIEVVRRLGGRPIVCMVASAGLFASGHYLNGGVAHGLSTFPGGLVLAYGYLFARPHGFRAAFICASTAHAMHNFVFLFVVAEVFPNLA